MPLIKSTAGRSAVAAEAQQIDNAHAVAEIQLRMSPPRSISSAE
jgi:hypothetical protein